MRYTRDGIKHNKMDGRQWATYEVEKEEVQKADQNLLMQKVKRLHE